MRRCRASSSLWEGGRIQSGGKRESKSERTQKPRTSERLKVDPRRIDPIPFIRPHPKFLHPLQLPQHHPHRHAVLKVARVHRHFGRPKLPARRACQDGQCRFPVVEIELQPHEGLRGLPPLLCDEQRRGEGFATGDLGVVVWVWLGNEFQDAMEAFGWEGIDGCHVVERRGAELGGGRDGARSARGNARTDSEELRPTWRHEVAG